MTFAAICRELNKDKLVHRLSWPNQQCVIKNGDFSLLERANKHSKWVRAKLDLDDYMATDWEVVE